MTRSASTIPATIAITSCRAYRLELLYRVAADRRGEVDDRPRDERAEQHGAARVAVCAQVDGGPDDDAEQHRVPHVLRMWVRMFAAANRTNDSDHRVRRDRDRRRQRREETLAGARGAVADDDQHEARERSERERALVGSGTETRDERVAQRVARRHEVDAEEQDETGDKQCHDALPGGAAANSGRRSVA